MKRIGFVLMTIHLIAFPLFSQPVTIPDTAFLYALIEEGVDTNGDSLISHAEAEIICSINISGYGITDMTGINYFHNLDTLICSNNSLTSLFLSYSPQPALIYLDCSDNQLSSLFIAHTDALTYFDCSDNQFANLDLSRSYSLTYLDCSNNQLTNLPLSYTDGLIHLDCSENHLTILYLSYKTALTYLDCSDNQLIRLDISRNKELTSISLGDMPTLLGVCVWTIPFPTEGIYMNMVGSPNLYFTEEHADFGVDIPDLLFFNDLINSGVDADEDGAISFAEAEAITSLNVRGVGSSVAIGDLTGIEAFVNLVSLDCSHNLLTTLDLSNNVALEYLDCQQNWYKMWAHGLLLSISENVVLKELYCQNNGIASLDVSKNILLEKLYCGGNSFDSLDLSINIALRELSCSYLTDLNLSNNIALTHLTCIRSRFTDLDLSNNTSLNYLDCRRSNLTNLYLSNNKELTYICLESLPTLFGVCVWTMPFPPLEIWIDTSNSPNIYFTTECSDVEAPILVAVDTVYQPDYIESTSTEDGIIYLVPIGTEKEIAIIRGVCIDSVVSIANTPVEVPLSGLDNGIYWLYARDSMGNLSEPEAFTILGVGIKNSRVEDIRIYPNPINNLLTIETGNPQQTAIVIISLNGHLIFSTEMEGATHQIDLSFFKKGVYFITISSKDFVITRKIIKL